MVTQIQLGNIFSAGDKTIVTGGSSGLDIESLVEELSGLKRQPAVVLEQRIEDNANVSTALSEMRQLLDNFRDAANFLRNPPGVQNEADNIFEYRSAAISSNTSIAGSTYLSVTAEPGVSVGEYEIEITQLATRNIQTTDTFAVADADTSIVDGAGPLNSGVLTLGASATTVTLDPGDTLNEVVAKVNAVKEQSGVEATAIKVSDGNYRISFKTTETGAANNYDINVLNPGVFNVGFAVQQNALDAQIEFDNTTISRSTNSINDIVEGITFDLQQATPPGTTLEVGIEADTELAKQGVLNFVDAYNAFRLFTSRQSEVGTDGTPTEGAVLSDSRSMRQALSRINTEMADIVEGITGGDPSRLSDIGITYSDFPGDEETPFTRNIMTIDEDALDSALSADFEGVRGVFEFQFSSDDPNLQVFARTNSLGVADFTLNIDQTNQIFEATYDLGAGPVTVSLDKDDLTGGSIVLEGQDGTALAGMTFIYSDSGDSVVTATATQGISDRIFNTLEDLLEEDTGAVEVEISSIDEENTRLEEEIVRIDEIVERFRNRLLQQFSALEQAISSANTLLQTLDAQTSASSSS